MKKHFLSLFAMATMLFATSCSEEENFAESNKQNVTFTVELENTGTGSRAIAEGVEVGKGNCVDKLYYAVYEDGKEDLLVKGSTGRKTDGKFDVTIPLVNNLAFDIVFFAHDDNASAFNVPTNGDLRDLTFKTQLLANQETYDAFSYVLDGYRTNTQATTDVELKRILAQLNVATTEQDLEDASALKANAVKSKIVLKQVPTSFDARTQLASTPQDVTYDISEILKKYDATTGFKNEILTLNEDENYYYLAMAYVLANNESGLYDSEYEFYREGDEVVSTRSIPNLPLQRNYRTNVTGSILTQQENFSITLDTKFGEYDDNAHDVNADEITVSTVFTVYELNDILANKVKASNEELILNVKGLSTITEVAITIPTDARASSITLNLLDLPESVTSFSVTGTDYANPVLVSIPNGSTITTTEINVPNAHVTLKNGTHTTVYSATSGTTLEVAGGATIGKLIVNQGNVAIKKDGTVTEIARGENNEETIVVAVESGATLTNMPEDDDIVITPSADAKADGWTLTEDIVLDGPMKIKSGANYTIDLAGYTISSESKETGANYNLFDVRGTLTIKNGTITTQHVGENMGWSNSTNVFHIEGGGVLNLENVTAKNLGGSDMAFVAHLNNWGEVTLKVNNCTLESTYMAVRVFNSGNDKNNVCIRNSTLNGKYCFWVHNYTLADFGNDQGKVDTHKALLNLDLFNGGEDDNNNVFKYSNSAGAPVLFGFTDGIYFDEYGYELVAEGVSRDFENNYHISNLEGLKWLATATNAGNKFNGSVVNLTADIDLNNEQWTPIGTSENGFMGTFEGQNHTIKNLRIVETEGKEGKAYIGLFGYAKDATIQNVTFENVNLNIACLDIDHSQGHIGAVAGSLEGTSTIENVTVKGDIKVEATVSANGASRVAVVAGGNSYGNVTMKNVHVIADEGSYLKANNNVGALAGQLQGKNVFENCSSNIDVTGTKFFAGGLIGIAAGNSTFTNCHTTGDVTITAGREGKANDHYRVGGIAGGWADNTSTACVLTNCSYTGKISGTNADGSVASPLDYAGYVGRGYDLTDKAGSKVTIDGVDYVQAYSRAFGNYIVGDVLILKTAAGLKAFAEEVNNGENFAGKTVKLDADIDLNSEEWTPIGTKDNKFQGTFDGCRYTVSNLVVSGNNSNVGLFGYTTDGEIKNLTVNNAKVSGRLNVGVVAGTPYGSKYTDIKVTGHVEVNGFSYVGAVGGKNAYADWTNVTVKVDDSSYVKANSVEQDSESKYADANGFVHYRTYVGGVCGFNGEGGHTFKNITSNISVEGTTCDVGGLFGIAHYGNSFINCSSSGHVEITGATDATEAEEIGGIAGVWNNGGADVTFENCSFTGELKVNILGVDLSDNKIAGKAYSDTGTGKLIIK